MFPRFSRTTDAPRASGPGARLTASWLADRPTAWHTTLDIAQHACCCPARPAIIAVMPPAPGRPRATELLLCRHHYGASQTALAAAGAAIFDPQPQAPEAVMPATSEAVRLAAARARHPCNSWRAQQAPDA